MKPGDFVIKNTGGNKMCVLSISNDKVECGWFTDSYHESFFNKTELISFDEYKSVLKVELRDDKINQILK